MIRKRSGFYLNDQIEGTSIGTLLSRNQQSEIMNMFRKTNQLEGGISFFDLLQILKVTLNIKPDQHLKKDLLKYIEQSNIRDIDIKATVNCVALCKKKCNKIDQKNEQQQNQYGKHFLSPVDAFVALGGNPDQTGFVSKASLIHVIKNEFELTFDIQNLIESIQNTSGDQINFITFCALFEEGQEMNKIEKKKSLLSLLSYQSLEQENSNQLSKKVSYNQFQKYLLKMQRPNESELH